MITSTTPMLEIKFRDELVTKVDQIGQRTSETARATRIPRQQSIRKKRFSRFQVQQAWHREQKEAQILSNRLKYIDIQKQRQNRTLELAKQKYQKMMFIREQSLREKDEHRKKIEELNQQISKEAEWKVEKIKQERFRTTQSVRRVREKNEVQAKQIKQLTFLFEKNITEEKKSETLQKRNKVETIRENMQRSRMRLSQMHENKVKLGESQHKQTLKSKMKLNIQQHMKNSLLRQKLQQSITIAHHSKQQRLSKLREYRTALSPYGLSSRQKNYSLQMD